jgi:hypothetical protein
MAQNPWGDGYLVQNHSAGEMDDLLDRTFGMKLRFEKFEQVGRRLWARHRHSEMKELVWLSKQVIGCEPWAGFSLDYAPHWKSGKIKWHRGRKTVSRDLLLRRSKHHGLGNMFWIDTARERSVEQARLSSGLFLEEYLPIFDSVRTSADLLPIFEVQKASGGGFYSQPRLVQCYAFTLAKIGRLEAAEDEFKKIPESDWLSDEMRAPMLTLLRTTHG